jgi:arsenite methyltransferase
MDEIREEVRRAYAARARTMLADVESGCCESGCRAGLYEAEQRDAVPVGAVGASLGCGNPTTVLALHEGDTVLDLGSGGGIDALLAARRVGLTGTVYGLDMTDEMLELARRNAEDGGLGNVHFLKGVIEDIPLPAGSVDAVISNCVVNLSPDKRAVLGEIVRVLRPGGRVGISDVVAEDRLSPADRAERGSYVGCVAGALSKVEYEEGLTAAGLHDVTVEFTHPVADGIHAAIIRAVKPPDPVRVQPGRGGAAGGVRSGEAALRRSVSDVKRAPPGRCDHG